MEIDIETIEGGVIVRVKVVPGGSRDAIIGVLGNAMKIKVSSPAEGGKANKAVCQLIAKSLGVSEQMVSVKSGTTQPNKRILIEGVSVEMVEGLVK